MSDKNVIEEPQRRRPGRPSLSNEELLDKALDLFLEKGFAGTSIDAICLAAGMAKRTVYARYGDKETLFKEALVRAIKEWIVPIEQLRALECDDFFETLMRIGDRLVRNVLSPAGLRLMRLTNAESVLMPEIATHNVHLGTEPTLQYLVDLFDRYLGSGNGALPYAQDAAQAFLNLVVGGPASNAAWGMQMDRAAIDRQVQYSVRLFLYGLQSQSDTLEAVTKLSDPAVDLQNVQTALEQVDEALAQLRGKVTHAVQNQQALTVRGRS